MNELLCPEPNILSDFALGRLDEENLDRVAAHLDRCPQCLATLQTLDESGDTLLLNLRIAPQSDVVALPEACQRAVARAATFLDAVDEATTAGRLTAKLGRIRDYELIEELGRGGMGAVYKALHVNLKRLVALKILPVEKMQDRRAVARFHREMEAVGKLVHPNIVLAHDAGEADGQHYLVMEYVDGLDLAHIVDRCRPLAVADACELVRQAAVGLEHAHQHGLVHRDIKPSNLMLSANGQTKILDLGLALLDAGQPADSNFTGDCQLMGTADYMAPEQAGDSHTVDIRADIYSLGCTLYKLLVGRAPFSGPQYASTVKKLMAHAQTPVTPAHKARPDVPPTLSAILERMMAKSPADRFASSREVAEALAPFTSGNDLIVLLTKARQARTADEPPAAAKPTTSGCTSALEPTVEREAEPVPHVRASGGSSWRPGRKTLLGSGGAAIVLLTAIVFFVHTKDGQIRVEIDDPEIEVAVKGTDIVLKKADGGTDLRLSPGDHALIVRRGDLTFETNKLELKKGDRVTVKVELVAGEIEVKQGNRLIGRGEASPGWHGWPADAPLPAVAPFDAAQAKKHQQEWADYFQVPLEYTNSIGMKFVLIPPGEFIMGSTPEEIDNELAATPQGPQWDEGRACTRSEGPRHKVTLTRPFYLGTGEVSQKEYEDVTGKNPSRFAKTGREVGFAKKVEGLDTAQHPVDSVNWNDATDFCTSLSNREGLSPCYSRAAATVTALKGTGYRLPTEAEWEFACRAGTTTKFWTGNDDAQVLRTAWCSANSGGRTHNSRELEPNPFGLFDIAGNVLEWVEDRWTATYYEQFRDKEAINPKNTAPDSSRHVVRGGHWYGPADDCRSLRREAHEFWWGTVTNGFRLALSADAVRMGVSKHPQ